MSSNSPDIVKSLFRRAMARPKPMTARARLSLTSLEDRTVPTPVVTIQALSDVAEGGGAVAAFRLTRSTTTGTLSVGFSPSGSTATPYSDFTFPFSVTFANGSATADVTITPINDTTSEPTETIALALTDGVDYDLGTPSSATVNLLDNDAQVVSVAKIDDAVEGGATGKFRLTRLGNLSSALTVNVSTGGTATSGTDYTVLATTITFAANSATADVTLTAANDAIYDPDETVTLTVTSGTGYTVSGGTATLTITDDISTVETLIHQETFQLTGASGTVNVTLTVTLNAPGADGLYTWTYSVSNPSSNSSSLTDFTVPIDGMDSDVGDLASSIGWTGTIGTGGVSWAAGTGLTPGSTATFAFTTEPREIGEGTLSAGGGGGFFADLPQAPAPREAAVVPMVALNFGDGGHSYTLSLNMSVAEGAGKASGDMTVTAVNPETARDYVYGFLKINGWAVEKAGTHGLTIQGKVLADGTVVAVASLTRTRTNPGPTSVNVLAVGYGSATVVNN